MNEWVCIADLAVVLNTSYGTVMKSLQRGKYTLIRQTEDNGVGRGGKIWLISIKDPAISEDIRRKYLSSTTLDSFLSVTFHENQKVSNGRNTGPGSTSACPVAASSLLVERVASTLPAHFPSPMIPEKFKSIALARLDLVKEWRNYRALYGSSKSLTKTDAEFERAYNSGLLLPNVYQIIGAIDIRTIQRWNVALSDSADWMCLVPGWHCEKGEPALTDEEKNLFKDCLLNPNRLNIGEATRITKTVLLKKNVSSPSAPITFRRWAEWFKGKNSHVWTFVREGEKALKDKEIFSIRRDPSKINVGEVLVADGHRLNFQVINPFTGKPCRATIIGYLDWKSWDLAGYEIMVEENTQAIASALRNSIIRLGKTPTIAYQDNGKAFRAKFFTESVDFEESGFYGLFGKVGIKPVFSQKYNAKAKPVERFWKEFTGKFECLLPSFTGSSIEDKPAWMHMGETFHRVYHNNYIPTINETVEMVEVWVKEYFETQPCPHVRGKTISEVFMEGRGPGVNINDLDELMMATEIKTIRANGIRFLGADYYDDFLFGLRERVYIKYSLQDLSYVKVFDNKGRYLGDAKRVMPVHPMAQYLGEAKDVAEVRYLQNKKRALQKSLVKAVKESVLKKDVLSPWADVVPMTAKTIEKLEEAKALAIDTEERRIPDCAVMKEPLPLPRAQIIEEFLEPELVNGKPKRPRFGLDEIAKYEWLKKYGCENEDDEKWMDYFMKGNLYRMICILDEQGSGDATAENRR